MLVVAKLIPVKRAIWLSVGVALFLAMVLLLGLQRTRMGDGRRMQCDIKLRLIGLALLNYESAFGSLPPAYTVDEDGQPLHSWRTLILPYLEESQVYHSIDFSVPWNHPTNAPVANSMPDIYRCTEFPRSTVYTSFVGVIGEGLVWQENGKATTLAEVSDSVGKTITVVESTKYPVHWMAPEDIRFEDLTRLMGDPEFKFLVSPHAGKTNAAFVDGSVKQIEESISNAKFKAMLTINAGD